VNNAVPAAGNWHDRLNVLSLENGENIMEPIILASGSLRRQEYFRILGLPFSIMPPLIDEKIQKGMKPEAAAKDFAVRKVKRVIKLMERRLPQWICGADTIISVDDDIFGKPGDREEAKHMLLRLSGREHRVITAMALYVGSEGRIDCRSISCDVSFAPLSGDEIEWYLNTGEWQGVAGSYRVQGIGACFIQSIKGPPGAVAGLSMRDFYVMLKDNGYPYGA
jgi:septum formation protein